MIVVVKQLIDLLVLQIASSFFNGLTVLSSVNWKQLVSILFKNNNNNNKKKTTTNLPDFAEDFPVASN